VTQKTLKSDLPKRPLSKGARGALAGIAGLLIFGFFLKLYRLDNPKTFYFDEVYHGFTATRFLHHDPKVFDPWAKSPEGVAYEWTHPPLSKLIMAGTMAIVGENSRGWRLGSTIFSTAAIGLAGLLAVELGQSLWIALLTVFFLTFEGLTFVQGRIAMNDSYFLFFMLLTVIFYNRWRRSPNNLLYIVCTGLGLGLSLATKWTAIYVFLIIAIDLIACFISTSRFPGNKLPIKEAIAWTLIPSAIYIGSYSTLFLAGGSWDTFVELQRQMWFYHQQLTQTHPYQSVPWQWILNLRPIWMHVDYSDPQKIGNIYNIGNSIILLSGLFAIYWGLCKQNEKKSWETRFLALCYFMLWLPWSLSPRIMLFYHYLPAVPFLAIFLARWVAHLLEDPQPKLKWLGHGILVGSILWFMLFFPHMTGIPVSPGFANSVYYFLPGWK
jgi:dolichyl-phosphate-mannose-protein mannosyltransferase